MFICIVGVGVVDNRGRWRSGTSTKCFEEAEEQFPHPMHSNLPLFHVTSRPPSLIRTAARLVEVGQLQ